jgi:hypothetical protein
MHTLANQHYLKEKDKPCPAHWSETAQKYQDSVAQLNVAMAVKIAMAPDPFREIMAAMHSEILQLRRMVSEGVILGMVRDEFWKQYAQVPIQVEDAAKVISALNEALREVANAAVEPEKEKRAAA